VGGVWEGKVPFAYMYRDGRLPADYVQAYMWFAIVGSSVVPPTDDDMKRAAEHMIKAQTAEAQRMARIGPDGTRPIQKMSPKQSDRGKQASLTVTTGSPHASRTQPTHAPRGSTISP
jgi:hypothetical protein